MLVWPWIIALVIAAAYACWKLLSRAPASTERYSYHKTTPRLVAAHRIDALWTSIVGRSLLAVTQAQAIERAVAATGLRDFGASDGWKKPFELLVDIQSRSTALSVDGRLGLAEFVHHCLCLRLRVQAEVAAHPELRDIEIIAPCVVTGVPRSGQSTIHNLLAIDPAVQCATLMEQLKVAPADKAQVAAVTRRLDKWRKSALRKKHSYKLHNAEDDVFVFHASFVDPMLAIALAQQDDYCKRYLDFVRGANMDFLYTDLRLFYQSMLFARKPDLKRCAQLCIKSPFHSAVNFRPALLKAFPDAQFVLVHRSLKAALGSFVSVAKTVNSFVCSGMDVVALTNVATDPWLFDASANTNIAAQLQFKMIMIDAVKLLDDVYRGLGWPPGGDSEARRLFLKNNSTDVNGKHVYDLTKGGLSDEQLAQRWKAFLSVHAEAGALARSPPPK